MAIFNSYVKLPEGSMFEGISMELLAGHREAMCCGWFHAAVREINSYLRGAHSINDSQSGDSNKKRHCMSDMSGLWIRKIVQRNGNWEPEPPPADCPIGSTIPRATEPLDRRLQPCCYLRLSSPYFWWMISLQVLDELWRNYLPRRSP